MPFPLNLLGNRNTTHPQQYPPQPPPTDDYDSTDSTDSTETAKSTTRDSIHHHRDRHSYRVPFVSSSSSSLLGSSGNFLSAPELLLPPGQSNSGLSSLSSTATSTPIPSRSGSPLPQFYSSAPSSTYTSDADSEPTSPLLTRNRKGRWWIDEGPRWWVTGSDGRRRRRRRDGCFSFRSLKRGLRMIVRHPLFPVQPTSIILTLFLFTIFAILLTLLLMHILNPDKEPLPWRAYCTIPSTSTSPPSYGPASSYSPSYPFNSLTPQDMSSLSSLIPPPFPPPNLDELPPAGVLIGVFSMDSGVERRMLVRSTWASHLRSRNGAGFGDGGLGTSRTVVRFILGKPRKDWERRIQLEAETYNDMVVLPINENMNYGKTLAFFTWAAADGWVPPLPVNTSMFSSVPHFSYSNTSSPYPIPVAPHDPKQVRREERRWTHMRTQTPDRQRPWVRPDFVVKADDDSFVMLAELESRLRLELHVKDRHVGNDSALSSRDTAVGIDHPEEPAPAEPEMSTTLLPSTTPVSSGPSSHSPIVRTPLPSGSPATRPHPGADPLVYWGYLVKNKFMGGELYGLSWSIVEWAARDPDVRGMARGSEDKQVAKWIRAHPRARDVRWRSERCWIYDHPRAGTVYSHGFLFPSEVTRVKKAILAYLSGEAGADDTAESHALGSLTVQTQEASTPAAWAYSSVSTFGVRYSPPLPDLTTMHSVEALIEGSDMSILREGSDPYTAWTRREGRLTRYEDRRVGGTVVVHYIKKNPWYLETALALLEGEEVTEMEAHRRYVAHAKGLANVTAFANAMALHDWS